MSYSNFLLIILEPSNRIIHLMFDAIQHSHLVFQCHMILASDKTVLITSKLVIFIVFFLHENIAAVLNRSDTPINFQ